MSEFLLIIWGVSVTIAFPTKETCEAARNIVRHDFGGNYAACVNSPTGTRVIITGAPAK